MFCRKCGKEINYDSEFCVDCAKRIAEDAANAAAGLSQSEETPSNAYHRPVNVIIHSKRSYLKRALLVDPNMKHAGLGKAICGIILAFHALLMLLLLPSGPGPYAAFTLIFGAIPILSVIQSYKAVDICSKRAKHGLQTYKATLILGLIGLFSSALVITACPLCIALSA